MATSHLPFTFRKPGNTINPVRRIHSDALACLGEAMHEISIGLLTIRFYLPGVHSLKQKRSIIKPVLTRLHREFNLSAAEIGHLDSWNESFIACTVVSNDTVHCQRVLQQTAAFLETAFPNIQIVDHNIEFL